MAVSGEFKGKDGTDVQQGLQVAGAGAGGRDSGGSTASQSRYEMENLGENAMVIHGVAMVE